MNKLRSEILEILRMTPASRPAALRRSIWEGSLYATDLPQAANCGNTDRFCAQAEAAGWKTERTDQWIFLDRIPPEPPEGWFSGPFGPEAACCASLLLRHADEARGNGENACRRLIKSGEESAEAYENVCRELHREWSAALRQGEALPAIHIKYFTGG